MTLNGIQLYWAWWVKGYLKRTLVTPNLFGTLLCPYCIAIRNMNRNIWPFLDMIVNGTQLYWAWCVNGYLKGHWLHQTYLELHSDLTVLLEKIWKEISDFFGTWLWTELNYTELGELRASERILVITDLFGTLLCPYCIARRNMNINI